MLTLCAEYTAFSYWLVWFWKYEFLWPEIEVRSILQVQIQKRLSIKQYRATVIWKRNNSFFELNSGSRCFWRDFGSSSSSTCLNQNTPISDSTSKVMLFQASAKIFSVRKLYVIGFAVCFLKQHFLSFQYSSQNMQFVAYLLHTNSICSYFWTNSIMVIPWIRS